MENRIRCFVDGSHRGNNLASIGYVVVDEETKKTIAEYAKVVVCVNSMEAELRAFHKALVKLRHMSEKGMIDQDTKIYIHSDNKAVVSSVMERVILKKYAISAELQREFDGLSQKYKIEVSWISRDENKVADKLANEAVKKAIRKKEKKFLNAMLSTVGLQGQESLQFYTMPDKINKLTREIKKNNILLIKMMLMQQVQEDVSQIGVENIWDLLNYYEGEVFWTYTGKSFTYVCTDQYIQIHQIRISKNVLQEAIKGMPYDRPNKMKKVIGNSYIFALLTDERIGVNKA